ncbi:MAG: phosphatase PAP2 family protein [Alphaproteobacteria bacterium]
MTRTQIGFAAALAAGLAFVLFPGLDLMFSGLFYSEATNFVLRGRPLATFFNDAVSNTATISSAALILGLVATLALRRSIAGLGARHFVFMILCVAIGPGLIANSLFKEHWGRARPRNVVEFGGPSTFTPPLVIADQCATNCSFVSGDAAQGFVYTALAFVVPRRRRRAVMAGGLTFGSLVGLERIMQGAHFLSDVIFAGLVVVASVYALNWLVLEDGWRILLNRVFPRPG